jgi:chromosome segregation ATPase
VSDVEDLEAELFVTQQRLAESRMTSIEAARQKDELRKTAAELAVETRDLRVRIDAAEAETRAANRERELAVERLASRDEATDAILETLLRAQRDAVIAYQNNDERDLQIDQLQLQIMELRLALARARGFAPAVDRAEDRRAASS